MTLKPAALLCLGLLLAAAACGEGEEGDLNPDPLKGTDAGISAPTDSGTPPQTPTDSGTPPQTPTDSGTPQAPTDSGTPQQPVDSGTPGPVDSGTPTMSFFVTSRGNGKGGDFRLTPAATDGLAGADAFCKSLAQAVSPALGAKTWRAYLSATGVDARDRIGTGPWRNQKGVVIATSVAHLHEEGGQINALNAANSLDENGVALANNVHDILTGSLANGRLNGALTCANWTSSAAGQAQVGHTNRMGGGSTSWNAVHATASCSATGVTSGGGRGSLYCFALEGG